MGMFKNILEKLGIKKDEKEADEKAAAAKAGSAAVKPAAASTSKPAAKPAGPAKLDFHGGPMTPGTNVRPGPGAPMPGVKPVMPPAMPMVDVVSKLDDLAKNNPEKLDWKVSIVDLLKLLKMDSSVQARKDLAAELGCPPDQMGGDNSKMNMWLHKTVLKKIAENGGNIPPSLLD